MSTLATSALLAAPPTAATGPNRLPPSLPVAEFYEVKIRVAASFLRLSDLKKKVLTVPLSARKGAIDELVLEIVSISFSASTAFSKLMLPSSGNPTSRCHHNETTPRL